MQKLLLLEVIKDTLLAVDVSEYISYSSCLFITYLTDLMKKETQSIIGLYRIFEKHIVRYQFVT